MLNLSQRVFGETHQFTIYVMSDLALTLSKQGYRDEAQVLQQKAIKLSKRTLAVDEDRKIRKGLYDYTNIIP